MVEIGLALSILVVAVCALSASNVRFQVLQRHNRERAIANNALRSMVEQVQAVARQGVGANEGWSRHVVEAFQSGGRFGETFEVAGLTPVEGETVAGRVEVIVDETEDDALLGVDLGLPRDLDGDGAASTSDVTANARVLPVLVRVRWTGRDGVSELTHPFYVAGF